MLYTDAKTDDARLVLRVLQEAQAHGGVAINYMAARSLLRSGSTVNGALLQGGRDGATHEVRARVVVNATGAWADGIARPCRRRAAPAATARQPPGAAGLAPAAGAGGQPDASGRRPPGVRLSVGRHHPGRHHRRRSWRRPGQRSGHHAGRTRLPDGGAARAVPATGAEGVGRDCDVRGRAPGDRQRRGRPVQGLARPCGVAGRRLADRHRRQADHLPRDRPRRAAPRHAFAGGLARRPGAVPRVRAIAGAGRSAARGGGAAPARALRRARAGIDRCSPGG